MKTLGDILNLSVGFLKEKTCQRSRRVAEEIIASVLGIKRLDIYLQFDRPMEESELQEIRQLLKRAANHEPVEYLLGKHPFYGCNLSVNSHVLIPRPETEILIDKVCAALASGPLPKVALDLCTGSGCLGIALKKRFPEITVFLSDISKQALSVAAENAAQNSVEVELLEGDLLAPFLGKRADLLLCNPPYVSLVEYAELDPSVRCFEPQGALVGGEDGLEYYRRLSRELPEVLNPGAKVFFEMGATQGAALLSLFNAPQWKGVGVEQDWSGKDRFFFLEFESVFP